MLLSCCHLIRARIRLKSSISHSLNIYVKMNKADLKKSHIGGKTFQAAGTAHAKALGQDHAWFMRGTARRPMRLEEERGGGGEGRVGIGAVWARLCGPRGGE